MRIVECYSHLNGLKYLKCHQPVLWNEIEDVIKSIDAGKLKDKISKEKNKKDKMLFSPIRMSQVMKNKFQELGWKESRASYWVTKNAKLIRKTMSMDAERQKREIEDSGEIAIYSCNQTDFVKNRIAAEVRFGKYSSVAFDLLVKHMAFFVGDVIDVGVEILPMKELQSEMSSGPGYYEGELYNLIRQGRGTPAVPIIMIGTAP